MVLGLKIVIVALGAAAIAAIVLKVLKRVMRAGEFNSRDFQMNEPVSYDWKSILEHPVNIRIETLNAGTVTGTVHKMTNLSEEQKKEIKDGNLKAPLMAHLIHHEKYGDFLIDTGFDSAFSEKPWGHFEGLLKKAVCKFHVEKGNGIDEVLRERKIDLKGVFCTHFHEHQGAAPVLPDDIPFVMGKGEKEFGVFPFTYSRFLKDKSNVQTIDFDRASDMPVVGKAADIFGDGSFWAISTPGHTEGHISYLINGLDGQYMVMGDICMCRMGYEKGVESGKLYAGNPVKNRESFLKIRGFMDSYTKIKPIFGHESDEFRITYL